MEDSPGIWWSLVVPFGLTNASAIFQSLINDVLHNFLISILIFSQGLKDHRHHVHQVLQRLLENTLQAVMSRQRSASSTQPPPHT